MQASKQKKKVRCNLLIVQKDTINNLDLVALPLQLATRLYYIVNLPETKAALLNSILCAQTSLICSCIRAFCKNSAQQLQQSKEKKK